MALLDSLKKFITPEIKSPEIISGANSTPININDISTDVGTISPLTALQCTSVWACVSLISESIACLPIEVKSIVNGKVIDNHPITKLMDCPNEWMDGFDLMDWILNSVLLTGNAYIYVSRDFAGKPVELLPLPPYSVYINQDEDWTVHYIVHFKDIQTEVAKENIIHIKGKSLDGLTGLSPISVARTSINLNLSAQDYSLNYYKNGGSPKGVLQHPNSLSKEARERLREAFDSGFSGTNSFRTAVLEEGLEYKQIGISNADLQFIESRKYGCNEIARLYRVPSHLIMSNDGVTTWGTGMVEQTRSFLQYSLLPWIKRVETSLNAVLIDNPNERIQFNLDSFLRGNTKERYESYNLALQWGYMSINEIRAKEGLNPVENGDKHFIPLNYTDLSNPQNISEQISGETNINEQNI